MLRPSSLLHWQTVYPEYHLESIIDQRRVRWIVLACLVTLAAAIPAGVFTWYQAGPATATSTAAFAVVNLLALLVLRATGSVRLAGHTLCATITCCLLFAPAPVEFRVVALLTLPLIAIHLTGSRWGLLWCAGVLPAVYFFGLDALAAEVSTTSLVISLAIVFSLIAVGSLVLENSLSDTTNRTQHNENKLEQQQLRMRNFMDSEFPGFIELTETRIAFASDGVEQFLGYPTADLIGQPFDNYVHPADLERLYGQVERNSAFRHEVRIRHNQGQWVRVEAVCIPDEDKRSWVVAFRDISEEFASRRRLAQAERLRALGVLAAGVAHDFNNLLTVILGFADMLQPSAEKQEITKAVEKAAELTSRLMVFGGPGTESFERVNLVTICDDMMPMFRSLLGERVEFTSNLQSTTDVDFEIEANAGQINQILLNVITNAKEALPDGGQCHFHLDAVTLDRDHADEMGIYPGRYARIRIKDTGTGMSEETLEQAFDPFFSTKSASSSRGLGLASVYGVMQQHHGHISLKSELHAGTEVTLLLPEAKTIAIPVEQAVSLASPTDIFSGTALVVEDEPVIRDIVNRILTDAGMYVICAGSGTQAITKFNNLRRNPDLLVTDVVMPGMKGPDLANALLQSAPGLKVLFISGYPWEELDNIDLTHADVQFLAKPFRREELLDRVRLLIDPSADVVNL